MSGTGDRLLKTPTNPSSPCVILTGVKTIVFEGQLARPSEESGDEASP